MTKSQHDWIKDAVRQVGGEGVELLYLRKSRQDNPYETAEEVLSRHEAIMQEYAMRVYGHTIPERYIYREVVSGETIDKRPEMKRLLKDIEEENVTAVLVVDAQRLSRGDLSDCDLVIKSFKYSRTKIVTPIKTYDLWDKFDERLFRDELLRGREYLEYTKEILQRGRKLSASEGWYMGSTAPFGWRRVKVMYQGKMRPTLEPDPIESKALIMMYEDAAYRNMSAHAIADKLDKLGFKPRRAEHFEQSAVMSIIRNPINLGLIAVGRRDKVETLVDGKVVTSRPRKEAERVFPGRHPALVSKELMDMAIENLGKQPKLKIASNGLQNPLAGILKCRCGRTMVYHMERGGARLLCPNHKYCRARSVGFDGLYEMLIRKLTETVEDFDVRAKSGRSAAQDYRQKQIDAVSARREELSRQQDRLYQFLESGTYDEETFKARNAVLAQQRAEVEEEYQKAIESLPEVINYGEIAGTLHQAIGAMKSDLLTAKQKNDFLKAVIDKVIYIEGEPTPDGTRWGKANYDLDIFLKCYNYHNGTHEQDPI